MLSVSIFVYNNFQCFPYIDLFVHTHEHEFSTIFSNFQTLLVTFFHKRYILTNVETFVRQTLAIIELEDLAFSWAFSYISLRQFRE